MENSVVTDNNTMRRVSHSRGVVGRIELISGSSFSDIRTRTGMRCAPCKRRNKLSTGRR